MVYIVHSVLGKTVDNPQAPIRKQPVFITLLKKNVKCWVKYGYYNNKSRE